jgi:lambda family phage portal protein
LIDLDRLDTPSKYLGSKNVVGGVRLDRFGAPVGYYIREIERNAFASFYSDNFKYVSRLKSWGRVKAFHIVERTRPEQTRGVSELVAALRETKIAREFRDITLQNAVVGAMFAASVESELPPEAVYQQLGGGPVEAADAANSYAVKYLEGIAHYSKGGTGLKVDGARIPVLYPGSKLQVHPVAKPGGVGQDFEQSLIRYLSASLGLSYEQLSKDFTQTTYSSARAAMLESWKYFKSRKKLVADRIANIVYRLWLEEAVNTNKLSVKTPNIYENDNLHLLSKASWIGASRGQIDTLKETQAAVLRLKYGLTTQKDELAAQGKDWRKVHRQLAEEKASREKYDIEFAEDNAMNAVEGDNKREPSDATGD